VESAGVQLDYVGERKVLHWKEPFCKGCAEVLQKWVLRRGTGRGGTGWEFGKRLKWERGLSTKL